jgi:hypothetical protein
MVGGEGLEVVVVMEGEEGGASTSSGSTDGCGWPWLLRVVSVPGCVRGRGLYVSVSASGEGLSRRWSGAGGGRGEVAE